MASRKFLHFKRLCCEGYKFRQTEKPHSFHKTCTIGLCEDLEIRNGLGLASALGKAGDDEIRPVVESLQGNPDGFRPGAVALSVGVCSQAG
jgi:hypothetical protein